jgi:hypothetical protein
MTLRLRHCIICQYQEANTWRAWLKIERGIRDLKIWRLGLRLSVLRPFENLSHLSQSRIGCHSNSVRWPFSRGVRTGASGSLPPQSGAPLFTSILRPAIPAFGDATPSSDISPVNCNPVQSSTASIEPNNTIYTVPTGTTSLKLMIRHFLIDSDDKLQYLRLMELWQVC